MKIYLKGNVYEEAIKRIEFLYDEFDEVIVSFSGGKDSTIVLNLAIEVARAKNRLPVHVFFIDQEAEWQRTIDYVTRVMYREEVQPHWLQVPFRLSNSTSSDKDAEWLYCWEDGKEWIRPKDPVSIKENIYGVDRFSEMFYGYVKHHFKGKKTASIGGVRCEESPSRYLALTSRLTYKNITWGKKDSPTDFVFYPIYDWSWTDVWKAIHDNSWDYNDVYNQMFRYGVSPKEMRVSSLCHETAIRNIYLIQEIERDNWNKLCERIQGFNTIAKLEKDHLVPKELPFMFESWREYRDYLVDNLVGEQHRDLFRKYFAKEDRYFAKIGEYKYYKECVKNILRNDIDFTTMAKFMTNPENMTYKNWVRGRIDYDEKDYINKSIRLHKELYGDRDSTQFD